MKLKTLLSVIGLIILAQATAHAGTAKSIHIKVDKMVCGNCAKKIKDQLAPLCKELSVDVPKKMVSCRYDDPTTAKQITSAIQKAGFDSQIVPN